MLNSHIAIAEVVAKTAVMKLDIGHCFIYRLDVLPEKRRLAGSQNICLCTHYTR